MPATHTLTGTVHTLTGGFTTHTHVATHGHHKPSVVTTISQPGVQKYRNYVCVGGSPRPEMPATHTPISAIITLIRGRTTHTQQSTLEYHHPRVKSTVSHQRVKKSAIMCVRWGYIQTQMPPTHTHISAKHTLTAEFITHTQHTTSAYHHPCVKSTVHHPHTEKSAIMCVRSVRTRSTPAHIIHKITHKQSRPSEITLYPAPNCCLDYMCTLYRVRVS